MMTSRPTDHHTLIGMALGLALSWAAGPAAAQRMVSIQGSTVNMRAQPSAGADILWELKRGFPLQVVQNKGRWLQVVDFEGDKGWVARSLTGPAAHYVVTAQVANLRKGPGTRHPVVAKLAYGDLLRTRAKRAGWSQVQNTSGKTGWVSQKLVWGW